MKNSYSSNEINNKQEYNISLLGEFVDKSMESEYLTHSMGSYSKTTSIVVLIFGIIFVMFLVSDYYEVGNTSSFMIIAVIRMLFLIISLAVFFIAKKIAKYTNLISLLTAYEAVVAIAFLIILGQYDSLRYLSFLSLMVVSLAIYILPNKIILSEIITLLLSILFFLYPAQKIEGLGENDIYKILAYQILLLIYCNINTQMSNTYKRKQFAAGRELLALSVIDPLTGIYNRAKFDEDMDLWVESSNRYGSPLSLIIFDIDDFKSVNDSYGHLIGDSVIKNIVKTIKKSIRNTDIFARWGGEEFVILLPDTNIQQAKEMAERIRKCIRNNLFDTAKNITCSFGIAALEKDDTALSLLRKADIQLLQAKAAGKDRVVCQLPEADKSVG